MNEYFSSVIKKATGAKELVELEIIQELWSGYGQIIRYGLTDSEYDTVVVKHVALPKQENHPRGWNSTISHNRKLKSYEVETAWYKEYAAFCTEACRIPKCLALEKQGEEVLMVLEDLDANGYPVRKQSVSWEEMKACICWLANFHVVFLQKKPLGLWETGTYWHLETRPEELEALDDLALKNLAAQLDNRLKQANYQTLVHGDAKLANFCFSENGKEVAAVDFQYVGGGCGMKDLAYFVGSCLYEEDCERLESAILDVYFEEIRKAPSTKSIKIDMDELEEEWRCLYPFAWTDFHRFLKGWSPSHWKINDYSERISKEVIQLLESEKI